MAVLLKTASVRVSFIQIMQVRVQNKGKSVWKSRYVGDVSFTLPHCYEELKDDEKWKTCDGVDDDNGDETPSPEPRTDSRSA